MKAGKTTHAYVIRVERQWMVLGMDATSTYHAFIHRLPDGVRRELEGVRKSCRASGMNFGWTQVVEMTRDMEMGASLVKAAPAPAPVITES